MNVIYKYKIEEQIDMPEGAEILHVNLDPLGVSCIWALVDSDKPKVSRRFKIHGTGREYGSFKGQRYIGTWIQSPFVWHLVELL